MATNEHLITEDNRSQDCGDRMELPREHRGWSRPLQPGLGRRRKCHPNTDRPEAGIYTNKVIIVW